MCTVNTTQEYNIPTGFTTDLCAANANNRVGSYGGVLIVHFIYLHVVLNITRCINKCESLAFRTISIIIIISIRFY